MPTGKFAHGTGPAPKTFQRWVPSAGRRGVKRFRVYLPDESSKLVAYKNGRHTARMIEAMAPTRCEALDDKECIIAVWDFPAAQDAGDELESTVPGYVKDERDTEDERVLKTFAHLLADAHKQSAKQLVEVVSIQAQHFSEERKSMVALRQLNEKLMAQMARKVARLRVATDVEGNPQGEYEDETAEAPDTFLQELFAPLIKRYVAQQAGGDVPEPSAAKNGAS